MRREYCCRLILSTSAECKYRPLSKLVPNPSNRSKFHVLGACVLRRGPIIAWVFVPVQNSGVHGTFLHQRMAHVTENVPENGAYRGHRGTVGCALPSLPHVRNMSRCRTNGTKASAGGKEEMRTKINAVCSTHGRNKTALIDPLRSTQATSTCIVDRFDGCGSTFGNGTVS